jgi:hypothetical protein
VGKRPKPTRAQRREQRGVLPAAGVYGVDVEDALADSWISRFVCYAESPDEARARIRDAGFHKRRMWAEWSPKAPPKDGRQTPDLGRGDGHWYRSRLDDAGWTPWEALPAKYRHQGVAALVRRTDDAG